jgi:HEAT repeat protein
MLLTNQVVSVSDARRVVPVLIGQLSDRSAFVRSWAISGLCILAKRYRTMKDPVLQELHSMNRDPMISVRHRARTAIRVLIEEGTPIPATWTKATRRGG